MLFGFCYSFNMLLGIGLAYFLLLHSATGAVSHLKPGDRDAGAGAIGAPSPYQSPRFRWWWPGGWIEPHEVQSEIVAMIDAGFGGAEIGDVEDSIKVQMDPQVYGWAQSRWNAGVAAACEQADRYEYLQFLLGRPQVVLRLTIGCGNDQHWWTLRPYSWPALANGIPWIHSRLSRDHEGACARPDLCSKWSDLHRSTAYSRRSTVGK